MDLANASSWVTLMLALILASLAAFSADHRSYGMSVLFGLLSIILTIVFIGASILIKMGK